MIRPIAALVIAAMFAAVLAQAPTRIRATLEQVDGNLLTLTTKDEAGKPVSVSKWRKIS